MQDNGNRKTLEYLGEDFQKQLIHTFLDEHEFFQELFPILNQNMFSDTILRTCVGLMKDYYEKYNAVPSYRTMETMLREKAYTDIDRDIHLATFKTIIESPTDGVDYVREKATMFFKQQNMIRVANEILRVAKDGDLDQYDRCVELIEEASVVGTHDDLGINVIANIDEVLSDEYRTPIPTGIEVLDDMLEGGIGKGEVGLIIGPSGFGKTSVTTSFATEAAVYACEDNQWHGYRVLQIITEDKPAQIQRKHIAKITGIEAKDLSKPQNIGIVKDRIAKFPSFDAWAENLRIKRVRTGETSVADIRRIIQKLINSGFKPDMVVIDYFEALNHNVHKGIQNEYLREAQSMRQIEAMAQDFNIAIWVPSQGTKDSADCEVVTMSKNGGAVQKAQISHIVISIARTEEDKKNNKATIALLKNRAGMSGAILNDCYFNNGTCTVIKSRADMQTVTDFAQYNHKKTDADNQAILYAQAKAIAETMKK